MGQATADIEQHIYEKRQELGEHIHELQHKAKNAVDWRFQLRERPWTVMGMAFATGLVAAFVANKSASNNGSGQDGTVSRMWSSLKSATEAVVVAKAKEFGREVIPRFREEYRKRELQDTARSDIKWKSFADADQEAQFGGHT